MAAEALPTAGRKGAPPPFSKCLAHVVAQVGELRYVILITPACAWAPAKKRRPWNPGPRDGWVMNVGRLLDVASTADRGSASTDIAAADSQQDAAGRRAAIEPVNVVA